MTKEITSELTEEVESMINEIKQNELARWKYTFLFNRYPDDIQLAIKEGKEMGREEGFAFLAKSFRDMGIPVDKIAKATGFTQGK